MNASDFTLVKHEYAGRHAPAHWMTADKDRTLCGLLYYDRVYHPTQGHVCPRCAAARSELLGKKLYSKPTVKKLNFKAAKRRYGEEFVATLWNEGVIKVYTARQQTWNEKSKDFQWELKIRRIT